MTVERESLNNIGFLCDKHSRKPDPKFLEMPIDYFIGKFCQLGFKSGSKTENMWVKVTGPAELESQELHGILANDPVLPMIYECGDELEFNRSEILQVCQ